jgi:uncharacterized protein
MNITPPKPAWQLWYQGINLTVALSSSVTSVSYHSKSEGASSESTIKVEDRNKRWQKRLPVKGDVVQLDIGYAGGLMVPCGLMQIDEVELEGPPDVITLKGISAEITPDMRTHFSRSYEGQTLLGIARTIAGRHGYEVIGAPDDQDVTLRRVTQKHETDLGFLRRMANLYGYTFQISGKQLIFTPRTQLEEAASIKTVIVRGGPTEKYHFVTKTQQVYKRATVSYFDPATKEVVTATVEADPSVPTGDTLNIPERAQDGQDARAKAKAALHGNNMREVTGDLTVIGDPELMAGQNIDVLGVGQFEGRYHIEDAEHTLTRSGGYDVRLTLRSVEAAA